MSEESKSKEISEGAMVVSGITTLGIHLAVYPWVFIWAARTWPEHNAAGISVFGVGILTFAWMWIVITLLLHPKK